MACPAKSIRTVITVLTCFIVSISIQAQEIPSLSGVILDYQTGLPIADAHVSLSPSIRNTVSDVTGHFYLYEIPSGTYSFKTSHLNYDTFKLDGIIVQAGNSTELTVRLKPVLYDLPGVTVSERALPAAGVLSGGKVISREQLAKMSGETIAGILEQSGLATISSDGSPGGKQTISLRGSASNQVLILVDGVPLNSAADGTADLSQISTAEIQQIEVYQQAPVSIGSQAIGGVINIVTLDPSADRTALQVTLSEYGERQAAITLGRAFLDWYILGIFDHKQSNGEYRYRVVADDGLDVFTRNYDETFYRQHADYRRDCISIKADPPGGFLLGIKYQSLFRHNPDYLPLIELDHEATTEDRREEFTLTYDGSSSEILPKISVKGEGYQQETVTDYGSDYPVLYNASKISGEVYSINLDWQRAVQSWSEVQFGTGAHWERVWSDQLTGGEQDRLHEFLYFQVQGNPLEDWLNPLSLGVFSGVRADLYRDEEAFIHPRLGIEVSSGNELYGKLRGEAAGAYRLPSFNSLFWKEDLQSEGNPDLKPERSVNQEYSATGGWGGVEASISYFDREITDLIYWRLDFDNRWKPLNIASATIYGIDYRLRFKSPWEKYQSDLTITHQWLKALNTTGETNTDGKTLIYRPEHTTTLSVSQDMHYLQVNTAVRWVGKRYTTESNTKSLSPYVLWDLGITKKIVIRSEVSKLVLSLRVTNLFDEEYRIVENAPTALREFWFSISFEQN